MTRQFFILNPRRARIAAPGSMRGVSLIELMTALTIGMLILLGLSSVFVNSSISSRELKNTAEQIENGRYAIELLSQDIRHAGFYGELSTLPAVPTTAPDPCVVPTAAAVSDTVNASLALPVQRIDPASIPSGCATLLAAANLQANSDIIVVRRADTTRLPVTCSTTATVEGNAVYLQTTPDAAEIQYGVAGTIDSTKNAAGAVTTSAMVRRDLSTTAGTTAGTCAAAVAGQFPQVAASIRKYRTHIYFVAPCSAPAGGGSVCTGASDDGGRPIPTLKRIELRRELSTANPFTIVSIVEGIQAIRFEYGSDTNIHTVNALPSGASMETGLIGDGVTDGFSTASSPPSLASQGTTMAMRVYVLARNTAPTTGYLDDKTYTMGSFTFGPANDTYKRHAYGTETRIANQAGRREIPR